MAGSRPIGLTQLRREGLGSPFRPPGAERVRVRWRGRQRRNHGSGDSAETVDLRGSEVTRRKAIAIPPPHPNPLRPPVGGEGVWTGTNEMCAYRRGKPGHDDEETARPLTDQPG